MATSLRELVDSASGTLEEGALLIAQDACPGVDLSGCDHILDELADRTVALLDRHSNPFQQVAALREVIYVQFGLSGNREQYDDPRNSFLHEVLDRKLGIPISLALVVMSVARRSGIVAEGISFPGHFLVKIGGPHGLIVDPFDKINELMPADLRKLYARATGIQGAKELPPILIATSREFWIRMLNNLRLIYEKRRDHGASLLVLARLIELDAGPTAYRDRGMAALSLGARAQAESDLSTYLTILPRAIDRVEVQAALEKARQTPPNWN